MLLSYGCVDCNGGAAQRLYTQPYHRSQTLSCTFFACVHQRLSDSGPFIVVTQKGERRARNSNNEDTVLDKVQNNPDTITRAIASHVETVWRILHTKDVYTYHPDMHPCCFFNVLFNTYY
ncbi:DUF4817 domain-containing protein [Trichonephila clavipes]|nr:DUF4817 domain-containing protein [Trichonephila clavipes]